MHWDSRGILCELHVKTERVKHCILKSLRVYGIIFPVSAVPSDLRQTAYRQAAFSFIHWLEQTNQCAELELERWNGPICIKVSNHVSEEVAWYARSTI